MWGCSVGQFKVKLVHHKGGNTPDADEWQSGGGATLNLNPYQAQFEDEAARRDPPALVRI